MINLVTQITLYTNTSINDALELTPSMAQEFFKSKAFEDWKNGKIAEQKLLVGIAQRLNNVIKSINNLGG